MLRIVATPIGNLSDISQRALDGLRSADVVLAEDTRRSGILLKHFQIEKKIISYHKFKEKQSLDFILSDLSKGKVYALISDAGTPCINDPGQLLVQACREAGLPVEAIPGPCSVIQALVLSGFASDRFQFIGFLPKSPEKKLKEISFYPGTTIAFESPQRLVKTLRLLDPERKVAVLREMTKVFEECLIGTRETLSFHFEKTPPKGEITLVFSQGEKTDDLSVEETVLMLQEIHGLSLKEAIQKAAHLKKVKKQSIYRKFHKDL